MSQQLFSAEAFSQITLPAPYNIHRSFLVFEKVVSRAVRLRSSKAISAFVAWKQCTARWQTSLDIMTMAWSASCSF